MTGPKVVFTNGCFDILHGGHIDLLRESKKLGDYLIVGLNSDISVKQIKGEDRPIFDQVTRHDILSAIRYVDKVIIFDEPTPLRLIKKLRPDVLTKGEDWRGKEMSGMEYVEELKLIPFSRDVSTTKIERRIIDRELMKSGEIS
jgi:D-beta-D-heptose 7-phosphate kinase/D-beta-D-heptose 1-phosphate adenosyltransferase